MLLLSNEDPTKYAQIKKNILYLSNKDKFFFKKKKKKKKMFIKKMFMFVKAGPLIKHKGNIRTRKFNILDIFFATDIYLYSFDSSI